jgi:divalent metal cation (Fe/Co/Zn/Cd) transporter
MNPAAQTGESAVSADRSARATLLALAAYLLVQTTIVFATGSHPQPSPLGLNWTAITAAVMFGLAAGKNHAGHALDNRVLITEARVTVIDGRLACAVLLGLGLNVILGWWSADPPQAS